MNTPKPCAECGATINADRDLDPVEQRAFELHLRSCALSVQVRISNRLNDVLAALDAIVTVLEGRLGS